MAEKATTLDCIGDKDIKMVDLYTSTERESQSCSDIKVVAESSKTEYRKQEAFNFVKN